MALRGNGCLDGVVPYVVYVCVCARACACACTVVDDLLVGVFAFVLVDELGECVKGLYLVVSQEGEEEVGGGVRMKGIEGGGAAAARRGMRKIRRKWSRSC